MHIVERTTATIVVELLFPFYTYLTGSIYDGSVTVVTKPCSNGSLIVGSTSTDI